MVDGVVNRVPFGIRNEPDVSNVYYWLYAMHWHCTSRWQRDIPMYVHTRLHHPPYAFWTLSKASAAAQDQGAGDRPAAGADAHPGPPVPWPGVWPNFFSFCSSFYLWTWINCWRRINILLRDGVFCMFSIFPFIFSCIFWTVSLWTSSFCHNYI